MGENHKRTFWDRFENEYTDVRLRAMVNRAVQQITITALVGDTRHEVRFLDGDSSNPGVKCEVLVIDATGLGGDLKVMIAEGAKIETMGTCSSSCV